MKIIRLLFILLFPLTVSGQIDLFDFSPVEYNGGNVKRATLVNLDKEEFDKIRESWADHLEIRVNKYILSLDRVTVGRYRIKTSTGTASSPSNNIHYRGSVKNRKGSVATLSFFGDHVSGMFIIEGETYIIERYRNRQHMMYPAEMVDHKEKFQCVPLQHSSSSNPSNYSNMGTTNPDNIVKIYFEIDNDIFVGYKTVQATINYIEAVFAQISAIYAQEGVKIEISEVFIHTEGSPYNCDNSQACLRQFEGHTKVINGDLGMLLSYKASGGIAWVGGLCAPDDVYKHSFSSIAPTASTYPQYSWTLGVIAHELGHSLGSPHTHACAWNGDNTAIDGCANFTEGSCPVPNPPYPKEGGTIMSYCHLRSVGMNLSLGFGKQPGDLIRSKVYNAQCLTDGGEDPAECQGRELTIEIQFDQYPMETSWNIWDNESGDLVASGDHYNKQVVNSFQEFKVCLPDGSYVFEIEDTYGDGICCDWGNGSYRVVRDNGEAAVIGAKFVRQKSHVFHVYDTNVQTCKTIDFNEFVFESYGVFKTLNLGKNGGVSKIDQDKGSHEVTKNGTNLILSNNAWKAIEFPYEVTQNTVIEVEFAWTREGDIHGIGFSDDLRLNASGFAQFAGTQNWGHQMYHNYLNSAPTGNTWIPYLVEIGKLIKNKNYKYLFFTCDDDNDGSSTSYYRNMKIYEYGECKALAKEPKPVDSNLRP